ncbi:uncharacterized protein K444DRAFT_75656 [Hyaloscypha bicolor E]|uniref:Uncharacterized protein n=1 Tax=Hyaloscypha bicolor E TaxID=1095630 RepID=A0A2J6SY08_9HELO|nr:uncharacterized protein K444DRAFT_75656 [Hyaloscypha bicolor E]PMD55649.1 hypothetical protein K444DRAFT_75656 [Hyaloscypha bicolor E]
MFDSKPPSLYFLTCGSGACARRSHRRSIPNEICSDLIMTCTVERESRLAASSATRPPRLSISHVAEPWGLALSTPNAYLHMTRR